MTVSQVFQVFPYPEFIFPTLGTSLSKKGTRTVSLDCQPQFIENEHENASFTQKTEKVLKTNACQSIKLQWAWEPVPRGGQYYENYFIFVGYNANLGGFNHNSDTNLHTHVLKNGIIIIFSTILTNICENYFYIINYLFHAHFQCIEVSSPIYAFLLL